MKLKWYLFYQNNSGGRFHYDGDKGLSRQVYVQASNHVEANGVLKSIGGYFDPDYEIDCRCCGTRWHPMEADETYNIVEDFEVPEKDKRFKKSWNSIKWMGEGKAETFVHPYDGEYYGTYQFSES